MAKFPSAAEKSCPPTAGTPSPHWYLHCSCCRHSNKAHWFQAGNLVKPWVGRKRKPWVVGGMFVLTKLVFCSFQIKQTLLSLIIFECFYFILSICREILQFVEAMRLKLISNVQIHIYWHFLNRNMQFFKWHINMVKMKWKNKAETFQNCGCNVCWNMIS